MTTDTQSNYILCATLLPVMYLKAKSICEQFVIVQTFVTMNFARGE